MDTEMIDNPSRDRLRDKAVAMMRNGDATMAEIAALADVSRQTVRYWAKAAGIDAEVNRNRRIIQLWRSTKPRRP